jgi:hypothetical protein
MSKKRNGRKIHLEYHYDRLSNRKMAQVYQALVPIEIFSLPPVEAGKDKANDTIEKGGNLNEDNGHLCTGFVEQTEDGKNN